MLREAATRDPRVIPTARAMHEDFDRRMLGPRMASSIAGAVGALTLSLACLGIFGVVSYGVALRTKEIGILADPVAFLVALLTFTAAGAMAAVWPALMVLRGNPVDALRHP